MTIHWVDVELAGAELTAADRQRAERALELALSAAQDRSGQATEPQSSHTPSEHALGAHSPADAVVRLVDDAESARLHGAHFADPTPTDVMTFPDGSRDPATGRVQLGDLAIGIDVARRVAAARGCRTADEVVLYALHGALHLLGHDDRTPEDRAAMWAEQRRILAAVGIELEPSPGD